MPYRARLLHVRHRSRVRPQTRGRTWISGSQKHRAYHRAVPRTGARHRVDVTFPNPGALLRLTGQVLIEQHDEWDGAASRYLFEHSLALLLVGTEEVIIRELTAARQKSRPRRCPEAPPLSGTSALADREYGSITLSATGRGDRSGGRSPHGSLWPSECRRAGAADPGAATRRIGGELHLAVRERLGR